MDALENYYHHHQGLLFIAPPGWGKTYKLLKWMKKSEFSFVYLSPLRALSEEVYLKAAAKNRGVIFSRTFVEYEKIIKSGAKFKLLICAFEIFDDSLLKRKDIIFVLDEFHLVYHWGETFREKLFDAYEGLFSHEAKVLLLTATMTKENLSKLNQAIDLNYSSFHQIDVGNHKLKNLPQKEFYYPKIMKSFLIKNLSLELSLNISHTILLFCKYRSEVDFYAKMFTKRYGVLTCKGGETQEFSQKLALLEKAPKLIIATTCLSHGVNLPKISRVYFTYQVNDKDFYIQMVGRGGRKGESYQVHSMETSSKQFTSLWRILSLNMILKLKVFWSLFK